MNVWFKRNATHLLIIALLITLCIAYFHPVFFDKTLGQNDVTRAESTATEIKDYREKGTTVLWTNQIHAGMPAFQIWAPYPYNITTWIVKVISYALPAPLGTVLMIILGAYLLFCVLKLDPWLAAAGAIAFTFSSYNIILLAAGHANQVFAIAFFAPVLAGLILIFRGNYLPGTAILAFFLALEIRANHIQMTYYLMLAILILVGIELYHAVKNKLTTSFLKSAGYAAAALILALAVNASSLWSTYDYSTETLRGPANLTQPAAEKTGSGLSREYAYQWSQGVEECITFLIPGAYGGSGRGDVNAHENVVKTLTGIGADPNQAAYIAQGLTPLYWGEKPFTEGSFYFGAVICFLFVLGLMIVKNRLKWWLLATVILTMFLSFGKNWPLISDIFFDYVPLYNKFRTVESILAVAGLCFPLLALLALQEVSSFKDKVELLKKIKISFYITFGISLIVALIPTLFLSFTSSTHADLISNLAATLKIDGATANSIGSALIADRQSAAQSDAVRSCIFVALAFGLLWAYIKNKTTFSTLSFGFLALVIVDMWSIDKRYLNTSTFIAKHEAAKPQPREVDHQIWLDKDPNYKVIDLSQSILSDATTPYFHKSIGGYSAARLRRFDEVIENQFSKGLNLNILGMMNTKYIITSDPNTQKLAVELNPAACGHAWFVQKVRFVKNADEEMHAITDLEPKKEVIVDQQYKDIAGKPLDTGSTTGTITLTSYNPDVLVYQSSSEKPGIAVFSEIFYKKGWSMQIDGVETPYFRANYLLRAAYIPAGSHKIEFIFHPKSYYYGEKISLAGSFLLGFLILGAFYKRERC
ncbi:hypothetical protein [Pedobacter frigoris]|uniref:hypothetical protein n=1 Tax=Pedobacter frigoris TaxID=2571272 RepID=UPI00292E207C|nr:hypothetical protein [Pedobacter frigoris]